MSRFVVSYALERAVVSRVDKMDPVKKQVLKMAAIVGSFFEYRILKAMLPRALTTKVRGKPSKLERAIYFLKQRGFIMDASEGAFDESYLDSSSEDYKKMLMQSGSLQLGNMDDDAILGFCNEMHRAIIYNMITSSDQKDGHNRVAHWIESTLSLIHI